MNFGVGVELIEFIGGDDFTEMVREDAATFEYYLTKSAIISDSNINGLAKLAKGYPLMGVIIGLFIAGYNWFNDL